MKNHSELVKIIETCRKKGVESVKFSPEGDLIELKLHPSSLFPISNYKRKQTEGAEVQVERPYSEEDVLFWSSAGVPESEVQ